jgi:hypothetical protein
MLTESAMPVGRNGIKISRRGFRQKHIRMVQILAQSLTKQSLDFENTSLMDLKKPRTIEMKNGRGTSNQRERN